ncbi:MAG: RluA family pseudouridine synthase [Bacteriovoracaceae bacterium]
MIKVSSLDPKIIRDAALKGAVWHQKKSQGKVLRMRALESKLHAEDSVTFYYDPKVLSLRAPEGIECISQNNNYSIWFKPAGVVTQGTQTGDHASLLRYVELKVKKEAYLVHRLDRETAGLSIVAHNLKAAARLSDLFQKNLIKKTYEAVILGHFPVGYKQTIKQSLDDKEAITHFEVKASNQEKSLVEIQIDTGRLHQIRRHFEMISHPVIGDPKYGKGNKNKEGLQLLAKALYFQDPWDHQPRNFSTLSTLTI